MTTKLHISPTLSLPLEAVMKQHFIVGQSSSGKTNEAVVLVEEFAKANQQFVVIDEPGVWWGLRSSADGKRDGLPVFLLGGEHGDMTLDPSSGAVIADFVVSSGHSFVLDLSLMGRTKWVSFMTEFCTRLYDAKATKKSPLHIVFDEADLFVPEKPTATGHALLVESIDNIARRGRARGLRGTFVTQRPQVINKSIIAQSDVLHVFRLSHPLDRNALDSWVRGNATKTQLKAFTDDIASLDTGHCFVWSPHWLKLFEETHIRRRETFDSSKTPEVGVTAVRPKVTAKVDLDGLKKSLLATIDSAKAEDPKLLRAKIASLEAQLAARGEPAIQQVEVSVLEPAVADTLRAFLVDLSGLIGEMGDVASQVETALDRVSGGGAARPSVVHRDVKPPNASQASAQKVKPVKTELATPDLTGPQAKILAVLAARHPNPTSMAQLSILSGYPSTSSTIPNNLGALRSRGLVAKGQPLHITDEGLAAVGNVDPLPTGEALFEFWLGQLEGPQRTILSAIWSAHPRELTKEQLSKTTGYPLSSSTIPNSLGRLRTLELVERGTLRLGEALAEQHP